MIPKGPAYQFRDSSKATEESSALAEATAVLRLLHIQDLRLLQTQINEAIVAVQKVMSLKIGDKYEKCGYAVQVTANPKTDTRLGKVGR